MATVELKTSDDTRRIEVYWGDGESDILKLPIGHSDLPAPGTNPLPRGTYRIQHAYQMPVPVGYPFMRSVLVVTQIANGSVDFAAETINIKPRWKITHYPLRVALVSAWDPFWVDEVEINVRMTGPNNDVKRWKWHASNKFLPEAPHHVLEGSAFSVEAEVYIPGNPESVPYRRVNFLFQEDDVLLPNDEASLDRTLFPHDGLESDVAETVTGQTHGSSAIRYAYGREIKLIRRFDAPGGGVFTDR